MGEFLSTPVRDKHTEEGENNFLKYASCGMQGWRKRMEDSHIADLSIGGNKDHHVFGVFDGHGGKEVAQWVKKRFTEELVKNQYYLSQDYSKALFQNFLYMDSLMQEKQGKQELAEEARKAKLEDEKNDKGKTDVLKNIMGSNDKEDGEVALFTGCTATVCFMDNKKVYFANAGDSRIVICKNGVATAMTIDHKPDSDDERKRIYNADGWVADGRVKGKI